MNRALAALAATLLVMATGHGDHPESALRAATPRAASAPAPNPGTASLPRFALFGWVSPPPESTTAARYAELAGAGFNVTVLALNDRGRASDNHLRLDYTRPLGVRNLLLDNDLSAVLAGRPAT